MTTNTDAEWKPEASVRPRWAWLLWAQLALVLLATMGAYLGLLNLAILALPGMDKLLHFTLFGLLAFFTIAWWVSRPPWIVLGILSVLAILEEAIQALSAARSFSAIDLTATLLGILVFGWAASRLVHKP
jgi:hypothetical protein